MDFSAPTKDILFNIEHISGWKDVSELPAYDSVDLEDAAAIMEEFGKFCAEEVAPLNHSGDIAGSRLEDGKVVLPEGFHGAYAQFVEMGWQSLPHPVDFGGQGLPRAIGAAATEVLNSANMSFALCPLLTDGAVEALVMHGSDAQKALYLKNLVTGKWTGTMNLTEPQAGSDLALLRTRAEDNGDGSYAITGTKIFITYGEHDMAENTVHLVLARTPGAPAGVKGISLFLVPKFLVNADGTPGERNSVVCQSVEHKLGIKASPTAVLEFQNAKGFLIGEENRGLSYMFEMMNAARYAVGLQGVSVSERAYQQALAFAQERVQSAPVDGSTRESVTIIHHPDVRRMLSRMRALTEGGRAIYAFTAGWQDLSRHADSAESRAEAGALSRFMTPIVKGYCTENSVEVASLGVQVHGGMGFIEETGAAQHYRDARILPIYEGTTAIQSNDLVGRKTLFDGGETALRLAAMVAIAEAELAQGSEAAQVVARRLARARGAFEEVVKHLLAIGRENAPAAFGAGVPYLMLTGHLVAGWQLARSMQVAEAALARGEDPDFMSAKIATARFFADHILPEASSLRDQIVDGGESLAAAVF